MIAGLGVIGFVRDGADNVDAAAADQMSCATVDQCRVEVMGSTVVLDHSAVCVGTAVQTGTVAVRRDVIAEYASHNNAIGELARGAEQNDLLVYSGWVPFPIRPGAQG